ncbi:hypothetical protein SORBI_3004G147300 [Sorghum bicolor]|uniref:F-box domain-containing protein n=1 Tax=Sorghum bicolor TaxID=4558 RepID=A0A194YPS5_SORBI|nr:hypothetical protein SORBI_3004G147300 [Sorghum bicolor]
MVSVRRRRLQATRARMENQMGAFAVLPQELILCVLTALSASVDKPADLFNQMIDDDDASLSTYYCKQFRRLMLNSKVLQAAAAACVSVRPHRLCTAAERFIRLCGDHGNADANFFLGMIQFHCFGLWSQGWSHMMMALRSGHAHAAFAIAGPRAAALLFALAACRGHMGALRDLAFCVTNGFSMRQDAAAGHRFTFTANLKEFRATYLMEPEMAVAYAHVLNNPGCLTSELGCFTTVPASLQGWAHPANRFLCEWFAAHPQLLPPARLPPMCSFPTCGRPETRRLHRSSTEHNNLGGGAGAAPDAPPM